MIVRRILPSSLSPSLCAIQMPQTYLISNPRALPCCRGRQGFVAMIVNAYFEKRWAW